MWTLRKWTTVVGRFNSIRSELELTSTDCGFGSGGVSWPPGCTCKWSESLVVYKVKCFINVMCFLESGKVWPTATPGGQTSPLGAVLDSRSVVEMFIIWILVPVIGNCLVYLWYVECRNWKRWSLICVLALRLSTRNWLVWQFLTGIQLASFIRIVLIKSLPGSFQWRILHSRSQAWNKRKYC